MEYLLLVTVFGLPIAGTFLYLGLQLLEAYHHAQSVLITPIA